MNDIEFSLEASPELGEIYKKAKIFSQDLNIQCLIELRGFAVRACEMFVEKADFDQLDLFLMIRQIERNKRVGTKTLNCLQILRLNGNKAAHPEQFKYSEIDFKKLTSQSMDAARKILEDIYFLKYKTLPNYSVLEVGESGFRDVCYKAIIENDIDSMFNVAMKLKFFADENTEKYGILRNDRYSQSVGEKVDQSVLLFKQAAERSHIESQYQYSKYLSRLIDINERQTTDLKYFMRRASENGHAGAQNFIGHCYFEGTFGYQKDIEYSHEFFEKAAFQDDPGALAQLGAFYNDGIGCEKNLEKALSFTKRSADAGYPTGQFNMFVILLNGYGVESDEVEAKNFLEKAAKQNFPVAQIELAIMRIQQASSEFDLREARQILMKHAYHHEGGIKAVVFYADSILKENPTIEESSNLVVLLQDVYEKSTDESYDYFPKDVFLDISKKAVINLRSLLSRDGPSPDLKMGDVMASIIFDEHGVPSKNRLDALKGFWDDISKLAKAPKNEKPLELLKFLRKSHVEPSAKLIASAMNFPEKNISLSSPKLLSAHRVVQGRNEICACGSGKKYKRCCG